jgi:hypothetical protein
MEDIKVIEVQHLALPLFLQSKGMPRCIFLVNLPDPVASPDPPLPAAAPAPCCPLLYPCPLPPPVPSQPL